MKCELWSGADPGFFLGGGALVSRSSSTPINHIVFFFLQNTSCIRKPQVISGGGGGVHPLHPPPGSPGGALKREISDSKCINHFSKWRNSRVANYVHIRIAKLTCRENFM